LSTHTALLIIDVQTGLVEGKSPVYQKDELLAHIGTLIDKARLSNTPIVYIQDNDVDEIGSLGWQVHPNIAPQEGDLVIRKPESDSFYDTPLESELKARNIKHLIVVGCKTEYCVDATCRRAVNLGYNVTLVKDAHSTTDNPILTAEQTIAYHNHIMQSIWFDDYGTIVGVTVQATNDVTF
jgi:nicotinamidase-related amidase